MIGLRLLVSLLLSFLFGLVASTPASSATAVRTAVGAIPTHPISAVVEAAIPAVPFDSAQERVALEAFFNATGGEHWEDSPGNGWLRDRCHCRWVGVQCYNRAACDDSPVAGVYRQSDQTDKNLRGVLPSWNGDPSHGALPQLQVLGITNNPGLTGTLPEAYGKMTQMMYLILNDNRLNGTLPEAWGEMTKMIHLSLHTNILLEGSLPLAWGKMKQMTDMRLNSNNLDGTLPEAWGGMTRMKHLNLRNNTLDSSLPKSWGGMTQMSLLYLSNNHLDGSLPEAWGKMTQMTQLYLFYNRLAGSLPEAWKNMTKMTLLNLNNNRFDGSLPLAWGKMTKMNALALHNNKLNGPLPAAWGKLKQLGGLQLHDNNLDGSLPASWGGMRSLNYVQLQNNYITGTLPPSWSQLGTSALLLLDISSNRLVGTLPPQWANISSTAFSFLSLRNNSLSGTLPSAWSRLRHLSQFYLDTNRLSGSIPSSWGGGLGSGLGGTRIGPGNCCWQAYTPDYPTCSGYANVHYTCVGDYCSAMGRDLWPGANPFGCAKFVPRADAVDPLTGKCTGTAGPAILSKLPNQPDLQVVALQNNSLVGTIPPGIINGSNLCILLLNDNRLRGRLPPLSPALFRPHCTIYSGLSSSSQFRPAVLVHNNRLSCKLPGEPRVAAASDYHGSNICGNNSYPGIHPGFNPPVNCSAPVPTYLFFNGTCDLPITVSKGIFLKPANTTNSLFLAGNRFSTAPTFGAAPSDDDIAGGIQRGELPKWMGNETHGDPMTKGAPFLYLHTDGWMNILSSFTVPLTYLIGGALALALATYGLVWRVRKRLDVQSSGAHSFDDSINMHGRTSKLHDLLIRSMAWWSGPLVLVMMPLYIVGANYYECGDTLVKTTSAYLANAVEIEGAVAVALVVVAMSSIVFAAHFRKTFDATHVAQRRRRQQQQQDDDGDVDDGDDGGDGNNVERATAPTGVVSVNNDTDLDNTAVSGTSNRRNPFLLFLLWVTSLLLLSFPSFIYGLISSVPTEDSIFGPHFANIATLVNDSAPIVLTFINSIALPAVIDYCCNRSSWQSAQLLLLSIMVTTWFVPVAVVVVFSNSCGRMWLPLWAKCMPGRMNELDVWGPSGDTTVVFGSVCTVLQGQGELPNGFVNKVVLVKGSDICDPSLSTAHQPYAQCGRAVVEAMEPLLIGQMAWAALMLPALTILEWRVAPAGWLRAVWRWEQEPKLGLPLDDMVAQSLSWLGGAIVFGPHIPLLAPLVLISLVTTRWVHESVGLRCLGLREERAEFSKPSTWYVLFSVVCQQALSVAVFAGIGDSGGGGGNFGEGSEGWMALMMMVVGAMTTIACVAVATIPVRWLEGGIWRCGEKCRVQCQCCCRERGEKRGRRAMTELSNRSLLGDERDALGGCSSGVGSTSTMRTLQQPLLQ